MRHKEAGWKLGRNTAHRRSLLRNLVTSLIIEERIETTLPKAKAMRPQVEKMITLGKRGDLAARRRAGAYLMTREAVTKLFDTVAPRFGDRNGGYLRIVRTGWNRGDGADKAFIELLGSEKVLWPTRKRRWKKRRLKRKPRLQKLPKLTRKKKKNSHGSTVTCFESASLRGAFFLPSGGRAVLSGPRQRAAAKGALAPDRDLADEYGYCAASKTNPARTGFLWMYST
jgi:large subunit ribosomal protein L17